MHSINIEKAESRLREIIVELSPGQPLLITQNGEPIATLERTRLKKWPCKAGSAAGTEHWMASDFDAPLEDFRDYVT